MKRKIAVFTIAQNEPVFLSAWSRYYRRHVPAIDLFVLDHDSTDATTLETAREMNLVPVHCRESFNHRWLRDVVERFQEFLLQSYELVLFTEVDEIVAPDPRLWPGGLMDFVEANDISETGFARCTGYEVVHQKRDGEPPLDWARPILRQRQYCRRSNLYSKPLLAARPLEWEGGFHRLRRSGQAMVEPDSDLLLLHLHRVDYDTCHAKTLENASRQWSVADLARGSGYQNRIVDDEEFERWFYTEFYDDLYELEPIPSAWKEIV